MKKITFLLFFAFLFKLSFAQPVTEYWDEDKKQKKEEQNFFKGLPHGKYTLWYKNGQVDRTGYYYLGLDSGEWKSFYEDGKMKSSENYLRGKKYGKCSIGIR